VNIPPISTTAQTTTRIHGGTTYTGGHFSHLPELFLETTLLLVRFVAVNCRQMALTYCSFVIALSILPDLCRPRLSFPKRLSDCETCLG
jgi:hypothetical protein